MSTTISDAARDTWAAHYATPDGFRYMPSEELVRFCGRRGALGHVLEVGCGNGANLWYLTRTADEAVGVDFTTIALQAARALCDDERDRRHGSHARLVAASAYALPFADASFDTVVDVMVSQHVAWGDHVTLYREYRRVLRRGGTAFVYHLGAGTTGTRWGTYDYPAGIDLFPAAGHVCLPDGWALHGSLVHSGFGTIIRRGMDRTYPDGERACYVVIEGTAQ